MKLYVFDFDGTLVDSKKAWIESIYSVLKKYGYDFSRKHIEERIGARLRDILKELKIRNRKIRSEIHREVEKIIKSVKLAPGIERVREIENKAIVSNASRSIIVKYLKDKDLKFKHIIGEPGSKSEALRILCGKYKIKTRDCIYVADRNSDREAARKAHCAYVLVESVSWDKGRLKGNIIKSLRDIPL